MEIKGVLVFTDFSVLETNPDFYVGQKDMCKFGVLNNLGNSIHLGAIHFVAFLFWRQLSFDRALKRSHRGTFAP